MKKRSATAIAAGLFVLSLALAASGTWLHLRVADATLPPGTEGSGSPAFLWLVLGFTAVGALVAARRPANPIGWLLLAEGLLWQLNQPAGDLRTYLELTRGGLAGAAVAAWVFDVWWIAPACVLPLIFLLFPSGRLPSPRWRVALIALAAGTALLGVAVGFGPGSFTGSPRIDNPFGVAALGPAIGALETTGNLLVATTFFAGLASLVVRYRRSDPTTRQQLKWLALAVGVVVTAWAAAAVLEALGAADPGTLGNIRTAPLLLIPLACGVAVLKYRLYDIDLVINRLFVYGGLAVFVVALYVAVVVGVGAVVGSAGEADFALSVAATATAALAFDPARRALQRVAARAVYGRRATPYEALASMTRRVEAGYLASDVLERMARSIAEATGGRGEVWVARGDRLGRSACWPPPAQAAAAPQMPLTEPPAVAGRDATFPVRHGDQVLGALTVTKAPGEPIRPAEHRLLADLADSAAYVLENARLVQELRSSRQRLVAAQDGERRRVERDLHDGAQQRLLELALTLRRAERQVTHVGAGEAAATLADADRQLQEALRELRDLARGIHPAILTEQGLEAAVESLAARPVELHLAVGRRLGPTVESTAYFVTSEALANVAKHAGGAKAQITITCNNDALEVEVVDDGAGGADPAGSGLRGLADRVAALDGRFEVTSEPGRGTRVRAVLPCA